MQGYAIYLILRVAVVLPFVYFLVHIDDIRYRERDFVIPLVITLFFAVVLYYSGSFTGGSLTFTFGELFFYFWPLLFLIAGVFTFLKRKQKKITGLKLIKLSLLFGIGHISYFYLSKQGFVANNQLLRRVMAAVVGLLLFLFLLIKFWLLKKVEQ